MAIPCGKNVYRHSQDLLPEPDCEVEGFATVAQHYPGLRLQEECALNSFLSAEFAASRSFSCSLTLRNPARPRLDVPREDLWGGSKPQNRWPKTPKGSQHAACHSTLQSHLRRRSLLSHSDSATPLLWRSSPSTSSRPCRCTLTT